MRLFIGLHVPDELREKLDTAWSKKTGPGDLRPIEPDKWHFTLAFLGKVPEENIGALKLLIEQAIEHTPKGNFKFTNFETFPSKNPSYLIAKAEANPKEKWISFIESLRDMVSVAAPEVDRKPWVPHVSIARIKKGYALPNWSQPIEEFEWVPTELTLIRSEIDDKGSKYTNLHVFPLKF